MAEFIGKFISITCENGVYQGQIIDVTPEKVTLANAFKDACLCAEQPVTIPVRSIKNLELISIPKSPPATRVKVERPLAVRAAEIRQTPEKPRKVDPQPSTSRKLDMTATKKDKRSRKTNETFGDPTDVSLPPDFDFEKNLALFDKIKVNNKMNAARPDLLRQVDKKRHYRCDENVLEQGMIRLRQIIVPDPLEVEYVTDSGLIVPAVSQHLRRQIAAATESFGLTFGRQAELMGRAATDLSLQLLGGGHRLNPQNEHQCPNVAVLAGCHRSGALACNAARQLAGHGVRVTLYVKGDPTSEMIAELRLVRPAGCRVTSSLHDVNAESVDLTILAWADSSLSSAPSCPVSQWAQHCKAPVLALDPPQGGTRDLTAKISLTAPLPLPYDQSNGRIYLCNLGIPTGAFQMAGVDYQSPFGPKFVLPLHTNDL